MFIFISGEKSKLRLQYFLLWRYKIKLSKKRKKKHREQKINLQNSNYKRLPNMAWRNDVQPIFLQSTYLVNNENTNAAKHLKHNST